MLPWFDLFAPRPIVSGWSSRRHDGSSAVAANQGSEFELLATGLGLLAVLVFLLSVGVFLIASQLVANPDLRFVLWNTTFLISFVSLVVLRRFTTLVIPGPQAIRTFPRAFSAVSAPDLWNHSCARLRADAPSVRLQREGRLRVERRLLLGRIRRPGCAPVAVSDFGTVVGDPVADQRALRPSPFRDRIGGL